MSKTLDSSTLLSANLELGLEKDIVVLKKLLTLLDEEHQALIHNDVIKLEKTVATQENFLESLNQHQQTRESLLAEAGLSTGKEGLELALKETSANIRLQKHRCELQQLQGQLQEKFYLNYALIQRGQQFVSKVLNLIYGNPTQDTLYNANAQPCSAATVGRLTKA